MLDFLNSDIYVIASYLVLVGLVIFSAERASNYVDRIDKKTNIGGAILGGLLLAGITSLPELITTLTSTAVLGKSGLAFGNIFGSNIFNVVILAVMDIYFFKNRIYEKMSNEEKDGTNKLIVLMHAFIILPIAVEIIFNIPEGIWGVTSGNIGFVSIIIMFMYIRSVRAMIKSSKNTLKSNKKEVQPIKNEIIMMTIWSIILVVSSLFITTTTESIVGIFNINESFAGAIFLGIATSLPEFTAVYSLVKKNNIAAAVSNITGSIVFNIVILSFVDFITPTNLYAGLIESTEGVAANVISLLILGLINIIILLYAFRRKKVNSTVWYLFASILILTNYLGYLIMSSIGIF